MHTVTLAIAIFLMGVFDARAEHPSPLGPEFLVNTFTFRRQNRPSVAVAPSGAFMVAWQSRHLNNAPAPDEVFARCFDAAGNAFGNEFQVTTDFVGGRVEPSVAVDSVGNFVVAWQDGFSIVLRRYGPNCQPLGGVVPVEDTDVNSSLPVVAASPLGGFAVVWSIENAGIFARRFDSAGNPQGGAFEVAAGGGGFSAAFDSAGALAIVWPTEVIVNDLRRFVVAARTYAANGAPLVGPFQVNDDRACFSAGCGGVVSLTRAGNVFAVSWIRITDSFGSRETVLRRFDANGQRLGGEIPLSGVDGFDDGITADAAGNFVVAYSRFGVGIFARRFDVNGNPLGGETLVSSTPAGTHPAQTLSVDSSPSGDLVFAWGTNLGGPPSGRDVFARRFTTKVFCFGLPATIVGTAGDDVIVGTAGPDVIHGRGGFDVITGKEGDDVLCGGGDADLVKGGKGDDVVKGGRGDDTVKGGTGNDALIDAAGFNVLNGGDDVDSCTVAPTNAVSECEG